LRELLAVTFYSEFGDNWAEEGLRGEKVSTQQPQHCCLPELVAGLNFVTELHFCHSFHKSVAMRWTKEGWVVGPPTPTLGQDSV
jgi:hypothetical protein